MNGEQTLEAASLEAVVIHLTYLRNEIRDTGTKVTELAGHMATKVELESLRTELNKKFDDLRAEVRAKSVGSRLERALTLVTKLGAAATVLFTACGGLVLLVRYLDGLKKLVP